MGLIGVEENVYREWFNYSFHDPSRAFLSRTHPAHYLMRLSPFVAYYIPYNNAY